MIHPAPAGVDVPAELAAVRGELSRIDTKISALLGLSGTAASVVGALAALGTHRLPAPARVGVWVAVLLLAASVAVLLLAIRPRLPRPGAGHGWIAYAYATTAALAATTAGQYDQERRADLIGLARLARGKHRRFRAAVDLMLAALLLLAALLPVVAP
ncbi:hypothetical protein GCM10017673_34020 [Streptosporangium violaceochromogenes]|nr:hypothetical protein GCM10017673_34020 [Streptosporangium violaceochromogenes]